MVRLQIKLFVTLITLAIATLPVAAPAQSGVPTYAVPPAPSANQETIHGKIASYDGAVSLQINDDRGFIDNVQLQSNTVVNPNNALLQPGSTVTIVGEARGSVFAAERIDVAGQPDVSGPPPPALVPPAPLPPAPPQPPLPQPPLPPQPPGAVALAPGSVLTGILRASLDSKNAAAGEDVTLHDVASTDGSIAHATLLGTVTDVTRAGQGKNAQIRMHFDALRLPDGTVQPIDGVVVSVEVKTKSNAAKEIGGALVGMLAGNAIGKMLGINGGGVFGAAGGFLIAKDNREDIVIPANTAITVQLENPRRQAH